MKRWLAVIAGGFGLVAYVRRRRRRSEPVQAEPVQAEPADELRAKLAHSREEEPREEQPASVTDPAPAEVEPELRPESEAPDALGDRRQDVHERARAAMDELG